MKYLKTFERIKNFDKVEIEEDIKNILLEIKDEGFMYSLKIESYYTDRSLNKLKRHEIEINIARKGEDRYHNFNTNELKDIDKRIKQYIGEGVYAYYKNLHRGDLILSSNKLGKPDGHEFPEDLKTTLLRIKYIWNA